MGTSADNFPYNRYLRFPERNAHPEEHRTARDRPDPASRPSWPCGETLDISVCEPGCPADVRTHIIGIWRLQRIPVNLPIRNGRKIDKVLPFRRWQRTLSTPTTPSFRRRGRCPPEENRLSVVKLSRDTFMIRLIVSEAASTSARTRAQLTLRRYSRRALFAPAAA